MGQVLPKTVAEAQELLEEVRSWPEEDVEKLPKFYREKAREYRGQGQDSPE